MVKYRNSLDSLFRAQKIGGSQMVLINSGQNGSYIMKGKCLESTEGGASEHELAGCNFHKDKQCFLPPWIFCSLSEQKIGVNC